MNTLTVVEIPRPRTAAGRRPSAPARMDFRLTLAEELRHADADESAADWLLPRPRRRSLLGRVLGRA